MTDEPFGRQPQPVRLEFKGEQIDIDHYMSRIVSWIKQTSYDTTTCGSNNSLTIYPRAVND